VLESVVLESVVLLLVLSTLLESVVLEDDALLLELSTLLDSELFDSDSSLELSQSSSDSDELEWSTDSTMRVELSDELQELSLSTVPSWAPA
jgi:hypothetical protein